MFVVINHITFRTPFKANVSEGLAVFIIRADVDAGDGHFKAA